MPAPHNKYRTKVSAKDLRDRFNRDIQPRINNKTYVLNIYSENPTPPQANQPAGTKSTMYEVLDKAGTVICLAHVYILPNGDYGGWGKLDPKRIRVGQITYFTTG